MSARTLCESKGLKSTYLSELYIVVVELLLHDLLQYAKSQHLCLLEGHLLAENKRGAIWRSKTARTLCHLSCSSLCAASEPEPIAFAS